MALELPSSGPKKTFFLPSKSTLVQMTMDTYESKARKSWEGEEPFSYLQKRKD